MRWEGFILCKDPLICDPFLWYSLSSDGQVYQDRSRSYWRPSGLLVCPLQPCIIFHLTFECVTSVNLLVPGGKHRLRMVQQQIKKKKNPNTVLDELHCGNTTVSILLSQVYGWGDLAAHSVKRHSAMSLRGKLRTRRPLCISEMSISWLAISVFTWLWNIYIRRTLCFLPVMYYGCHDGFVY